MAIKKRRYPGFDVTAGRVRNVLVPISKLVELMLEGVSETANEDTAGIVEKTVKRYTKALLDEDDVTAPVIGRKIYALFLIGRDIDKNLKGSSRPSMERANFWRTPLGQLIFERGGFPERSATVAEAAAVLGVTRQATDVMRKSLKLRSRNGAIFRTSLYTVWTERKAIKEAREERRKKEGGNALNEDREAESSGDDGYLDEFEAASLGDIGGTGSSV